MDGGDNANKLLASLEQEQSPATRDDETPIEQSDNSLVRLINTMIVEAHKDGVSDIHVESYPGREKIRIRFRKDGLLRTYLELPPNYRNAMIARTWMCSARNMVAIAIAWSARCRLRGAASKSVS